MGQDPTTQGGADGGDERVTTRHEELEELRRGLAKEKSTKDIPLFFGDDERLRVEYLPTGISALDTAMSGGFAFGRITELYGEFSSGKTLLALLAIKEAQARGLTVCFVDIERAADPGWMRVLGVDIENTLISRPRTGEDAWDLLEALCIAGVNVVVMDSLAQMVPADEADESMHQSFMGLQARMINKGLRKVTSVNENTAIILINQLRSALGVVYGNPETLPGGKGQGFIAHQMIRVRRGPWIEEGTGNAKRRVGYHLTVKIEKSKAGGYDRRAQVPFYFTGIIDEVGGLVPLAVDLGIIEQRGGWYTVPGGDRIFGMVHLIEKVRESEELQAAVRKGIEEVPTF